jgi:hypothetical protein
MESLGNELSANVLEFIHDPFVPFSIADFLLSRFGKRMQTCRIEDTILCIRDIFNNLYCPAEVGGNLGYTVTNTALNLNNGLQEFGYDPVASTRDKIIQDGPDPRYQI